MGESNPESRYPLLLSALKIPESLGYPFLEEVFKLALETSKAMGEANPAIARFGINAASLTLYIASEHAFYLQCHPEAKAEEKEKDEAYKSYLASVSLDKYFTNEKLAFRMGSLTSRYSPLTSTIDLYLNFILGMLSRYKRNDPSQTLIVDVMNKGFQMAKCVSSLLENGFETEAFSTWRTLHENECILHCLLKYGKPAIDAYLKHMRYALAFRGGIKSKEETDEVFANIKSEMKSHDLKSKDMKRFIEYGWLYLPGVEADSFKLNFRDGVEKLAGLSSYSKVYEMSSEIAHSSPLLIYSKKDYFFTLTLLSLYESFFRLEKVFTTLYMSTVPEEERARYVKMRSLYHPLLLSAYGLSKRRFSHKKERKADEEPNPDA